MLEFVNAAKKLDVLVRNPAAVELSVGATASTSTVTLDSRVAVKIKMIRAKSPYKRRVTQSFRYMNEIL